MDQTEWDQLNAIRQDLNANLMAYGWETQEKFTELFVKSIEGKGDFPQSSVSRTA